MRATWAGQAPLSGAYNEMSRQNFLTAAGEFPVAGDDVNVAVTLLGVPAGRSVTKAWLTFKAKLGDADPGVVQKILTSGFSVSGTTVTFTFALARTDTALFTAHRWYFYDVQVKDDQGALSTPLSGGAIFRPAVTAATS